MDEIKIRQYARLMREQELTALEIREGSKKIRLERNPAPAVPAFPMEIASSVTQFKPGAQEAEPEQKDEGVYITSPMVGVFYAAPTEDSDPYVSVGTQVKAGDTLCIIEAMKLMNEVPAEFDGTITEICVENGQVVEFGTKLFRIEK